MGGEVRGKRILVVEDNPKNLKLVTDLLTFRGHEVLTAEDGETGIEAAVRETHAGPRVRASRAFGTGRTRSTGRKRLDID